MKKAEIQIGHVYIAKVSGKLAPVRILRESRHGGWEAVNMATRREIRVRSAARLRQEHGPPAAQPDLGPAIPPTDLTTPRLAPSARGIRIAYVRAWRQQQHAAGRASTMAAFWMAHGLCATCHGRGTLPRAWPFAGDRPCDDCGGTGTLSTEAPDAAQLPEGEGGKETP